MSNICAVFKKQIKDTLKNKTILIQFIMFPLLTVIMNHAIKMKGMPENFYVSLFATMYVGMAPLTSMAAIIAEEKETQTLRVLLVSNVKPYEYLLGVGSYVWLVCMIGAAIICGAGDYGLKDGVLFMAIMSVGIISSLLIGAVIGIRSRTQMMATGITVPVMMVLSFLPMLSLFNTGIAKFAAFIYSEQISRMLFQVTSFKISAENIWIVAVNILITVAVFHGAYKEMV